MSDRVLVCKKLPIENDAIMHKKANSDDNHCGFIYEKAPPRYEPLIFFLCLMDSKTSEYFKTIENNAPIHIQKMLPGPPR